jgi:MoaA/NifB/PqqE/SkfB family radical SAM enzyme
MRDRNIPWSKQTDNWNDISIRLAFARDNGCNTLMFTGENEPQQNMDYIEKICKENNHSGKPFRWLELQTTGVGMKEEDFDRLAYLGINTVSISLSNFNDDYNMKLRGHTDTWHLFHQMAVDLLAVCRNVKRVGMNLRLSINLTKYIGTNIESIFETCKMLEADQITFRRLYEDGSDSDQTKWVRENKITEDFEHDLLCYITSFPKVRILESGNVIRSIQGMGVTFDADCMAKEVENDDIRYIILRPNGKLYSSWDDTASLIF